MQLHKDLVSQSEIIDAPYKDLSDVFDCEYKYKIIVEKKFVNKLWET